LNFFSNVSTIIPQCQDISNDLIPYLEGKIFSYHTNKFFCDIGTPDNYEKVLRLTREVR